MSSVRPGPVCNRCRQVPASEGDSWCSGCTSWEALGRELAGHWDVEGCRVIATDIVLNCVRQVRALRSLGAGVSRLGSAPTVHSSSGAGSHRAQQGEVDRDKRREPPREPLPRSRGVTPPPPVAKAEYSDNPEEEEDVEESEEEEEDERTPSPNHRPIKTGHPRPPEPDSPPTKYPKGRDRHHSTAGQSRAVEDHSGRERSRRGDHRRRRSNRRGGRKHQRLYRLATNPHAVVHRKPPANYWDLSCLDSGVSHLDRAILQQ